VPRVTLAVLERLAPLVARWRERGFALPVLMDYEYLRGARDTFPMELDDIRRQHRLLAGADLFADLTLDPAALRRECEREARGKLLRLRALFLEAGRTPAAIEQLMVESVKSFIVVLRHLLRLRHADGGYSYAAALALLALALPAVAAEPRIPPPEGFVTDRAGVIPPATRERLVALLAELRQKTGAEIAVVTVPTTAPLDDFTYAMRIADAWKPGR